MSRTFLRLALVLFVSCSAFLAHAQQLMFKPLNQSGIYALGEKAGWTVSLPAGVPVPAGGFTYTLKQNGLDVIKSGKLELADGPVTIETALKEPAMLFLEVLPAGADGKRNIAGAAIAPTKLQPVVPCPADFDTFWASKIKLLKSIPAEPVLTSGESGKEGVEYATIKLNNIGGAHVYGQLAKPAHEGKFPAMLIMQWASPPYPLQKPWVTDRAAEGWLVLDVEPHDVPGDLPPAFYAALPQLIKNYTAIYNDDRERNYFLQMYLGDYRALDYLASRPDWDGKTLLVMGTSMGGQQSICVAGLHPQVTHLIVNVPAGADSNATLHGRAAGYPNWDLARANVKETALYFDTVNFAARIKATCMIALGFVDETCPPVGVWTMANQIPSPKEIVPMIESPHNHLATPAQLLPCTTRSAAWLSALVKGEAIKPASN
jgi:cephalosporin-C deacetylase-like acetyl esterase